VNAVKLLPKHFAGQTMYLSPNWISNGEIAVRRSATSNGVHSAETLAALLKPERVVEKDTDSDVENLITPEHSVVYTRTPILIDKAHKYGAQVRLYVSADGQLAAIDEKYLILLDDPNELHGAPAVAYIRSVAVVEQAYGALGYYEGAVLQAIMAPFRISREQVAPLLAVAARFAASETDAKGVKL
jgi:hypothetical protein